MRQTALLSHIPLTRPSEQEEQGWGTSNLRVVLSCQSSGLPSLHLQFLGGFQLTCGDILITGIERPRLQSYLVLHVGIPQSRTRLAALLWPDSSEAQAHTNLRNLLCKLRKLLPWTIVRFTQFHDYVLWLIHSFGADTRPVVAVPGGMRFQSIDVGEVADRLVSLVEQGPCAHTPDMGGPQVCTIEGMTEAYLRIQGRKATIRPEAATEDLFNAFTSGINLVPDHAAGSVTWEAFLRHRYTPE